MKTVEDVALYRTSCIDVCVVAQMDCLGALFLARFVEMGGYMLSNESVSVVLIVLNAHWTRTMNLCAGNY